MIIFIIKENRFIFMKFDIILLNIVVVKKIFVVKYEGILKRIYVKFYGI